MTIGVMWPLYAYIALFGLLGLWCALEPECI
jgi:hypothetical protein